MKLIIDINEKDFEFIKSFKSIMKNSDTFQRISADLFNAVKSGEVAERPQGVEMCLQCEFSSKQGWEMPCKECMHAYENRFIRADRKGGAE